MALPADADVRELLGRLRSGADYRWKGGPANDETLVDWRDAIQTEPLEADYLTELAVVRAEKIADTATRDARKTAIDALAGKLIGALTLGELAALVEVLLDGRKAIDKDGRLRQLDQWV